MITSLKTLMRVCFLRTFTSRCVFVIMTIFLFPLVSCAEDIDNEFMLYQVVSIDCQYETVNNVLNDISRQSGLGITYDQIFESESEVASIPFADELYAIDAVIRVLRGKNTVIEYNESLNNINIVMFDRVN